MHVLNKHENELFHSRVFGKGDSVTFPFIGSKNRAIQGVRMTLDVANTPTELLSVCRSSHAVSRDCPVSAACARTG